MGRFPNEPDQNISMKRHIYNVAGKTQSITCKNLEYQTKSIVQHYRSELYLFSYFEQNKKIHTKNRVYNNHFP